MTMVKPTGCERWKELFQATANRGKIYDEFLADRYLLTDHLHNCLRCEKITKDIGADVDNIPDNSISDDEFSLCIRELYRMYKAKNQTP